ncbi:phosphomethylpyrimidine kinase [Methanothermus fervidus DSM 2088]|uniref:Phosphomethylpyrimidine kinase n=1 Tax=Methanothermus fervidus (strain ATCC 43054 / DSM 2088 / JCM 10308 / V24 S) TaxID=523846 RepID=E3GW68_METFV|nr:bifunctional hydroxymethylpyrimidine kinase/phosphomethylpyrimidine kinase [Methanothermus fervidus]ADP77833.1 phosphomethylpyrimidine kinase [Methanothermus fervidus DSM 2088]
MVTLSIAGFDPSGGAGILNDIKTFSSIGSYGAAVITALTVQNTKRVSKILSLPPDFISEQIDIILEELPIKYCKTGMLYTKDIVKVVSKKIKEYNLKAVVDPVMVSESGYSLSESSIIKALKKHLLPRASLVTPNKFEAEKLSGISINNINDAKKAAKKIGEFCDVVITGGDLAGKNIVYIDGKIKIIKSKLIESENTHGTGCTFSAAVAAYLDRGNSKIKSIKDACKFTKNAILHGKWKTLNQFWMMHDILR